MTYWDEGFGKFNWIVWKNVVVVIFGLGALYFGTQSAITDILALYQDPEPLQNVDIANSTLLSTLFSTPAP